MNENQALQNAAEKINGGRIWVDSKPVEEAKPKKAEPKKMSVLDKWVNFVNTNSLAIKRDNKLYLRVEAWNYLFSLKGLSPTILDVSTQSYVVKDDDGDEQTELIYTVKAGLIPVTKDISEEIPLGATAFASCRMAESDFSNDYYSALSMAQTRAIGKLGRTVFGHLAVACGFQATPLEEMPVEKKK